MEVSQVSRRENDGVTQIQCKCGDLCSGLFFCPIWLDVCSQSTFLDLIEPLFVRVEVEIEGEGEHIIHFIYQPSGVLPPLQGEGCSTVIENYGYSNFDSKEKNRAYFSLSDGSDGLVSGLSFLAIACDDAYFLNGIATQQIWFEVIKKCEILWLINYIV